MTSGIPQGDLAAVSLCVCDKVRAWSVCVCGSCQCDMCIYVWCVWGGEGVWVCVDMSECGFDHLGWMSCANTGTLRGAARAPGVIIRMRKSLGSPVRSPSPQSLCPHGGAGQAGHASETRALELSAPHSSSVYTLSKAEKAQQAGARVPSLQARQVLGPQQGEE